MILRRVIFSILKFEYLSEIETELENTLACLSGAQMGSNDEKNWGSKISLDCPFKHITTTSNYTIYMFKNQLRLCNGWFTSNWDSERLPCISSQMLAEFSKLLSSIGEKKRYILLDEKQYNKTRVTLCLVLQNQQDNSNMYTFFNIIL